jgi:hypothetical protein
MRASIVTFVGSRGVQFHAVQVYGLGARFSSAKFRVRKHTFSGKFRRRKPRGGKSRVITSEDSGGVVRLGGCLGGGGPTARSTALAGIGGAGGLGGVLTVLDGSAHQGAGVDESGWFGRGWVGRELAGSRGGARGCEPASPLLTHSFSKIEH